MEDSFILTPPYDRETQEAVRRFKDFTKSTRMVASNRQRLIEEYESQWIGAYRGKIVANADTMDELYEKLKEKGIPPEDTFVDFMTKEKRMLLL